MNSAAVLLPPGRRSLLRDGRLVLHYLSGTCLGALVTACAAWVLSGFAEPIPTGARIWLVGLGLVLVWVVKWGPLSRFVKLPEARRQIPAEVFGGPLGSAARRFGFEMGTGVRTYVPSIAPYVLLLALLLGRPPLSLALLAALGFGCGRAVPLAVQAYYASRQVGTPRLMRFEDPLAPSVAGLIVLAGALPFIGS